MDHSKQPPPAKFGQETVLALNLYFMSILAKIKPLESKLDSELVQGIVCAFGTSESKRNPGTMVHWAIARVGNQDYMVANPNAVALTKGQEIVITAYENKAGEAWLQL